MNREALTSAKEWLKLIPENDREQLLNIRLAVWQIIDVLESLDKPNPE